MWTKAIQEIHDAEDARFLALLDDIIKAGTQRHTLLSIATEPVYPSRGQNLTFNTRDRNINHLRSPTPTITTK